MAIIKCKMCGGDLVLSSGQSVAECEYCGSVQTVPSADNEKKLTLFARANRLRAACDFDKAAGIYESIVADFPEDAEAYWGLVLCKYGIEYVDDPATGKKIPTCHRSSYDSVMDDANFEQAMENADVVAQKVYREEAKQFERIRKGILEVSSSEKPYDIFICYKETAPDGDRTLDSVLAQDLYSALTDKGYRVFFSRITLQGKLGEAYEPYIFAALNSAKVMLAVGTCYEYYNAVWVKNEWSRYLKICEADKSKHLIPCYKDLDPEDMPKEFNHLQGADLGKMGAVQDILFNMEKYIPLKKENTNVIQERVVVGGSGANKIASLLDRGNMALEDGDWAKADSFFEDVLNNDSKNAQAYLGKTLAQERCRTIDAFARKRKDASQNVRGQKLSLSPKNNHIGEMVSKCSLPGYVESSEIRALYNYDLTYHSEVADRKQQYRSEEAYWTDHRQLSRAEKFATGAVAENLTAEKKALFEALNERIKKAESAETAAKKDVLARYERFLAQADEKAEQLYAEGLKRREADYEGLLKIAKASSDVEELTKTAQAFVALGDYQDSRNLAEHCRKRAAEEQAKLDAEAERLRIQQEKKTKARKARNKTIALLAAAAAVVAIAVALVMVLVVIPGNKYQQAEALKVEGNTAEAAIAYGLLGDFKDAREKSAELWADFADRDVFVSGSACAAVTKDGKVVTTDGYGLDEFDVANWTDVVAIAKGHNFTAGLRADGTVLVAGENNNLKESVSEWKDIVSISANMDMIVGLKSDGTVVIAGQYWRDVEEWNCIVAVATGRDYEGHDFLLAVRTDGTMVGASDSGKCDFCKVPDWTDITAINVSGNHMVGLKADGTVVATGDNSYGQCDVSEWQDIIAITCGSDITVGLKADGTVVAVGDNENDRCNLSSWVDMVDVFTTIGRTVGLTADGQLVFNGIIHDKMSAWSVLTPEINPEEQALRDAAKQQKMKQLAADYAAAEELLAQGDNVAAALKFGGLDGYEDAMERSLELWKGIACHRTIDAGRYLTLALKEDGTVLQTTDKGSFGAANIEEWANIVSVSAGYSHAVGLRADGTVAAGNDFGWRNIVDICAGSDVTVGLKADGTVIIEGDPFDAEDNVSAWTDIIDIEITSDTLIGLKADGTVVVTGDDCDVSGWTDIVAVTTGAYHALGLKADGTVVAAGWNSDGQGEVADWTDIVAVAAGNFHSVGLRADGTVVAAGDADGGRCNVDEWQNIVAISADGYHTVGLKADGTVVAVGGSNDNEDGRCDVSGWIDVKIPQ